MHACVCRRTHTHGCTWMHFSTRLRHQTIILQGFLISIISDQICTELTWFPHTCVFFTLTRLLQHSGASCQCKVNYASLSGSLLNQAPMHKLQAEHKIVAFYLLDGSSKAFFSQYLCLIIWIIEILCSDRCNAEPVAVQLTSVQPGVLIQFPLALSERV